MSDERRIFSVSELNSLCRSALENVIPGGLWLGGEIRNLKSPASGHLYFAITDGTCTIDGVMWRSVASKLSFAPENGMSIEAFGTPTLYDKTGRYQFSVRKLVPVGEGARAIAFRQLKEKLEAEGLFDSEYKKPLPAFPFRIGVVTSGSGAAIRDIINVLARRAPYVTVVLRPAKVQGDGAARDIVEGIRELDDYGELDLLIIGRGGGSEEDLWCFNDEGLARAIFDSGLPIISAVGHEIDFSISDMVADVRAPTPSAAAEIAVRDIGELLDEILGMHRLAGRALSLRTSRILERLKMLLSRPAWEAPLRRIREHEQRLDDLLSASRGAQKIAMGKSISRLNTAMGRLSGLGVGTTLRRGFAIILKGEQILSSARELRTEDKIDIRFSDGKRSAKVVE